MKNPLLTSPPSATSSQNSFMEYFGGKPTKNQEQREYFHSLKDGICSNSLGFAMLNGAFHLSTHENILTIALINIHS